MKAVWIGWGVNGLQSSNVRRWELLTGCSVPAWKKHGRGRSNGRTRNMPPTLSTHVTKLASMSRDLHNQMRGDFRSSRLCQGRRTWRQKWLPVSNMHAFPSPWMPATQWQHRRLHRGGWCGWHSVQQPTLEAWGRGLIYTIGISSHSEIGKAILFLSFLELSLCYSLFL